MKTKRFIIFFLIIFSYFIIPIISVKGSMYYVEDIYQVNESTDDAVYYVGSNYYDDDDFLLVKSNLYDTKTGLVFNNISIYDNATFTEVFISLYSNDTYVDTEDYWVTIYGIDEDNSSTFSDFEDFNNRSYTTDNVNWNLEDLEGLDIWVNSTNLASIFNEIKSRSGWSSGNNIGLYILSVKSDNAYRMCMSFDGNSTYAPRLYTEYVYEVKDEECTFIETYKGYDIYLCEGNETGLEWGITDYHVEELCTVAGEITHGADVVSTTVMYAKGRWWSIVIEKLSNDLWLYNSTNQQTWSGTEIDTDGPVPTFPAGYMYCHSATDSNDDIHVAWTGTAVSSIFYRKITTFSNGSISVGNRQTAIGGTNKLCNDLKIDGDDYPVLSYYRNQATRALYISGSSTKDGIWTTDYNVDFYDTDIYRYWAWILPMSGNSGKDFLIIYTKTAGNMYKSIHARYFNEVTETAGPEYDVCTSRLYRAPNADDGPSDKNYDVPYAGVNRIYKNNETFFCIIFTHTSGEVADRDLFVYRTVDGGETFTNKTIYNSTQMPSPTDIAFAIPRMDSIDNLYVFRLDDDHNAGNHTFFYYMLENDNIDSGFTGTWDEEEIELYDCNNFNVHRNEAFNSWSVSNTEDDVLCIAYGVEAHDATDECQHVTGGMMVEEGDDCHVIYYEGVEVARCFPTIDDAEDWVDEQGIKYIAYQDLGNTISWMLGVLGLIMMPLGFVLFAHHAGKGDYSSAFLQLMISFLIGMSLFIGWMWG